MDFDRNRAAILATSPPGASGVANFAAVDNSAMPLRKTSSKFKGIRDLEERDPADMVNAGQFRKEGLLWSLSRPGAHIDPKAPLKAAWHK